MKVGVVIPALNEAETVGVVVCRCRSALEGTEFRIVVADNGSADSTVAGALAAGAETVNAPERGYGSACLQAVEYLSDW